MQPRYVAVGLEAPPLHRVLDRILVLPEKLGYRDIGRYEHGLGIPRGHGLREFFGAFLARRAVHGPPLTTGRGLHPVTSLIPPVRSISRATSVAVRVLLRHEAPLPCPRSGARGSSAGVKARKPLPERALFPAGLQKL